MTAAKDQPHRERHAQEKLRARDLGVPFEGVTGALNTITDVAGVRVGHTTLISGQGPLRVGEGPAIPASSRTNSPCPSPLLRTGVPRFIIVLNRWPMLAPPPHRRPVGRPPDDETARSLTKQLPFSILAGCPKYNRYSQP